MPKKKKRSKPLTDAEKKRVMKKFLAGKGGLTLRERRYISGWKAARTRERRKRKNPELVVVNADGEDVKIPKDALDRFHKIHGEDAPLNVISVNAPDGMKDKYLVELGDAVRTDYKPPKGSKKAPHEYYHMHGDESGKNPTLVTTPDGKHLLILRKKGNKMHVDEWIHD